jgi:hypothetical protein
MINLKDEHVKSPVQPYKSTPMGAADPGLALAIQAGILGPYLTLAKPAPAAAAPTTGAAAAGAALAGSALAATNGKEEPKPPLRFADPGLLAAQLDRQKRLDAPYLHLKAQMKNFEPEKDKPTQAELLYPYLSVLNLPAKTQEPTDWKGKFDDLNRTIEKLTMDYTKEDANGYIPNRAPQLQALTAMRDKIRKNVEQLVEMRNEGYNGSWDPAFDPLVDSIAAESKAGQQILDGLQTVLDVVGFIPGLGEVADGLNAAVSLLRGNYGDAALSALSVIPFADMFTKLGKYIRKGAGAFEVALEYGDETVDTIGAAAKNADEALEYQIKADWNNPTEPDFLGGEAKNFGESIWDYETLAEIAEQVNVSTLPNQAVFYSGKGNRVLAETFASLNGKMTLEMTPGGKFFDDMKLFDSGSPLSNDQALEIWNILSQRYATGASGNVYGFIKGARPGSIFNTKEFPLLEHSFKDNKVTNMFTELFS